MATSLMGDIKKATKQRALNSVANNMFGSGILGKALGKSFMDKFGDKEEEDDRVPNALREQQQVQQENNNILVRLERIVTNISDNVYNIAGVLNDQVVSMREAKRLQEEQHSRDMAAQEEAAAESQKQLAPSPSATTPSTSDEKGKKGGLISSLLGSVGSTKKMFGSLLKKFAVVAVGLSAAVGGGALAAGALSSMYSDVDKEAPPSDLSAVQPTPVPQESESPTSLMTGAMKSIGGEQGAKDAPAVEQMLNAGMSGDMGKFIDAAKAHAAANPPPAPPSPPPTPVAPPPTPAATSPAPAAAPAATQSSPEDTIKQFESNIEGNNKRLADREKRSKMRVEGWKQKYADDPTKLSELLDKDKVEMDVYRGDIADANKRIQDQIDALKKQPSAPTSPPSASSSSSSGATPVPSSPSTGKDIGTQSTDVAAASEAPPKSEPNVVSAGGEASTGPLPGSAIEMPSPIANRGSLDDNTTFEARM